MKHFLTRLGQRLSRTKSASARDLRRPRARINPARVGQPRVAKKQSARKKTGTLEYSRESIGTIADGGPGKNVLLRNRHIDEATGTHDTLTIVDDLILDSSGSDGIDPYNTGRFDRSSPWDNRSRK